ncbi:hypothetical protein IHE49_12080 [Rhodanobacter sp. 7MK24]|uniref:hypothetical protein n=1 Tax=Rhodanobacter sp. 7MK24 TaxID=2775922 RepID=UPI0017821D21|nr:hypothetical protein [Rhodanobacter sp. 7MK24]MBD8881219.1 hypothetical protein [Rhodanobacter sp. 7MK24]
MRSRLRATPAALLIVACATATPACAWAVAPKFAPKVDARSYIDVWRLRHDVAVVEASYVDDGRQAEAQACKRDDATDGQRAEDACIAALRRRSAAYRSLFAAFNAAWLPAIRNAVAHGDPVAEVILRQCATTGALDRRGMASTCDDDPAQRAIANGRLRAIGFVPALDIRFPNWQRAHDRHVTRLENQQRALDAIRHGALGFDTMHVMSNGNTAINADDLQWYRNYALVEAALQDAPIAFTVTPGTFNAGWKTAAFATLKLNRQPLTPGFLTWGRRLYFAGSGTVYTGPHYWRSSPTRVYVPDSESMKKIAGTGTNYEQFKRALAGASLHEITLSGTGDGQFRRELYDTLATISTSIAAYLKQDPRWAVFLLHRVGLHEWVPAGTRSTTARLDRAWLGTWKLQSRTMDWDQPLQPANGYARITRDRTGDFQMIVRATPAEALAPFGNVDDCALRYSGGATYSVSPQPAGQETTALGAINGQHAREALAPLDPKLRYKQVLMQCIGAESPYSDNVRFLLLAHDHLIEIGVDETERFPHIAVRQYLRVRRQESDAGAGIY